MIYIAEAEDLKQIIEMGLESFNSEEFDDLPELNFAKAVEAIHDDFKKSPVFVYKEDGEILGFVTTTLYKEWWSDRTILGDRLWYVKPKYRSLKVINELIRAVRDLAKLNDMPCVIDFLSLQRTELKEKLFEKQGFKKIGFTVGILNV